MNLEVYANRKYVRREWQSNDSDCLKRNNIGSQIEMGLGRKEIRYKFLAWWVILHKLMESLLSFDDFHLFEIVKVNTAYKTDFRGYSTFYLWLLHFFIRRLSHINILYHILKVCFACFEIPSSILSRALSFFIAWAFFFTFWWFLDFHHIEIGILFWSTFILFALLFFPQSFSYLL